MRHPLRVRILAALGSRTASPNQLAGWLGASLQTTAYHVRVLESLDLLELAEETRRRGAVEHHYRALLPPDVSAGASLELILEYARLSAEADGFARNDAHLSRTQVRLDDQGWSDLHAVTLEYVARVGQIDTATRQRLAAGAGEEATVVVMNFVGARLVEPPPTG